mmetsp:Transcript_3920/g.8641  ORF Transcript_3920/g.8641 Transcript_3920/m.8641 type:complete len:383 (+) Transcript_3920:92-1240(+)|eukprot:CAMPEP_0183735428 /NCGR_PEP_ID=MMETSP0737-20130205/46625_1 /TAXON_ID=385413 /ORGANISM="Thalassiosira miniscula, Strain CCMP1093" /LENGTH=382 /DNA_ID=CAMNT_0025969165 /DNA_START=87 /DNA_END=1235 /DNA_ORIENTATION=-
MAMMKNIGVAILGLAVFIGTIGKVCPPLFFNLPFPLSIIFWASTGNSVPPYFMPEPWLGDETESWMKDGDLVVATGTKSGTTFMLYCAHQIRTKGKDTNDELFPDVSVTTPWPDMRQDRWGTWANQKDRLNTTKFRGREMRYYWDHPSYPFRIFKSHYVPGILPVRKKGGKKIKYLAMVRNGIDVAASMTTFFTAHTEQFRNVWGGFPPAIPAEALNSDEPPESVKGIMPGNNLEAIYFGYVKGWWPYRDDPNVLMLHYSNVRKDLKGTVAKLAKFLEVDLTWKELNTITKSCSLEHMKKDDKVGRFSYTMPLSRDKFWDAENDTVLTEGSMTRTGYVGKGQQMFTDAVIEKWRKAEEEQFGHDPAMLKWAREGGEFPPVEV